MAAISIDRLTLQVPGLSEADGRRLATAIAGGLAAAGLPPGATGDVTSMRVDLTAAASAGPDQLARQVIAEIVRQVQRLP